jgi:SRSO17 transposase
MSAHFLVPGAQRKRLAAYLNSLAQATGHADREEPLKAYCTGLLLSGEGKSVEPMAARLSPWNVRRTHQSLHHLAAEAPWSDEAVLRRVREYALAAMTAKGPVVAWVVGDTGLVKKGTHSVGVARQYCGQVGKQENCQVPVSLSVTTEAASLPVAWRLYLPESWAEDQERREERAGVPEEIRFETKASIALGQIRWAMGEGIPRAPVVADAGYGNETWFREALTALGLPYVLGVNRATTVWKPGGRTVAEKALERRGPASQALAAGGCETSAPFAVCLASCPSSAWGRKAH